MIDTSMWKEFHLYDIFYIDMGNKMDRGKMSDGNIAFVGRTANNNGINARVGRVIDHEKYGTVEPYKKGCITLALGGSIGSSFIQEEQFYTSQNVAVLMPKTEQSEYALRFITSVITHSVLHGKYEAFTEELNKHIKTDFVVSLPVTSDGQPDWAYMESYMKQIMEESEKSLENLKKADDTKHLIDVSGWGAFRVGDYFHGIRGTSRKMQELNKGQTPIIAAARYNQGITGFYDVPSEYENAITISCNGVGCGSTYYHDYPFAITGDAIVLENIGNVPTSALHFIASVYDAYFTRKYSYTDKCSASKAEAEMVALPATSDGQPDWQYMEDYMKSIMDQSEKVMECLSTYRKGKE